MNLNKQFRAVAALACVSAMLLPFAAHAGGGVEGQGTGSFHSLIEQLTSSLLGLVG